MGKKGTTEKTAGELVAVQPAELTVLPPDTGAVGGFLAETANMFRARGMRMKGLLGRINETGQRMESMLREAAERLDAAEAQLENDLRKQGLVTDTDQSDDVDE